LLSDYADQLEQAAIFNASGGFVRKPFLDVTLEDFARGWDVSVFVQPSSFL
jgi:hypothetical protein